MAIVLVSTPHIKGNIRNGEGAPQVWVHHNFYKQPLWDIWLVSNHSIISQLFCLDITEEGMATHSSSLAWSIPRTQDPGRLQSVGWKESDMTE